ncbi:WG repeat-containing protein [Robiginitalea sp. SC105]|uniref:WG repeat-containing protein n=1 Tax=Robiginitalea sp. SC105 TaxID=2762332 RepID=UPI00163981E8|nr:WG repeat-containing protein [Robiginitalea sp. SC105]MBC2839556.1 WG repeat-containing protein [Robiginitalea sp. SC105]
MKKFAIILILLVALPAWASAQTIKEINKPAIEGLDEVTPFHEGYAAVRKGDQWGFINTEGDLVIPFRDDLVWQREPDPEAKGIRSIAYPRFNNGRCPFRSAGEDDIPVYGFIDPQGRIAVQPEFLNVTEYTQGYAIGIYHKKTFRGKNNFQLNIYDYSFTEVILNPDGEMVWPLGERQNILMEPRRYKIPDIHARMLTESLIAVETTPSRWEIRRIDLKNNF